MSRSNRHRAESGDIVNQVEANEWDTGQETIGSLWHDSWLFASDKNISPTGAAPFRFKGGGQLIPCDGIEPFRCITFFVWRKTCEWGHPRVIPLHMAPSENILHHLHVRKRATTRCCGGKPGSVLRVRVRKTSGNGAQIKLQGKSYGNWIGNISTGMMDTLMCIQQMLSYFI